ncbi:MAG: TolC family protein [Acidobacteriaceae bacterium]|jgi:outer membrane protein TolC|nr:TolC family protein [Acidobacteriaceae bacterium]
MHLLRRPLSLLCALLLASPAALPQQTRKSGSFGNWWQGRFTDPFTWREIAPANLSNSNRLEQLLRAGKLYLSLQDTIALALENNLDIELQRFGPKISEADLNRAISGGIARNQGNFINTGTVQVGGDGGGGGNGIVSSGGIESTSQAVTAAATGTSLNVANFDPVFTSTIQHSKTTQPQTTLFNTGTSSLISIRDVSQFSVSKAFVSGTTVSLGFNNFISEQNSGRLDFNPARNVNASIQVQQRLLQGFGFAVNNRNIRIGRNNLKVSGLAFKQQVITTVAGVIARYWDLVAANEDVLVKRQALALNQKLYEDNKKQVEIGTLAPIEIIRAEAEVARSQQELTISETNLLQQETILKNALSRTGVASASLADARVIATDKIRIPETEPIEPIQDLVARAMENRPEVEQSRINIESAKIGLVGTRNALRPSIDAFGRLQNNGLSGSLNALPIPPVPGATNTASLIRNPASVDGFFLGGYGTALGQIFRRNFPDYAVGVTLNVPLRNRAAQSDMVREQLSVRQSEVRFQQQQNQVRVDVQNALISLQQARARYQTATKNRVLQEQTLDAEQKKYGLGASTIFFVIQAQRDLTSAQANEVAALSTYARARNDLERATGQTLAANNINMEEAIQGVVSRPPSTVPGVQ